jgi:DNA-binding transcriptional LysR family regulator
VTVGRKHAWWGREQVALQELNDQQFVARPQGSYARQWMDEALSTQGVTPRVVAEFDSPESVKRAVMAGVSLTILPSYAMHDELGLGMLQKISIIGRPLMRVLTLVWDKSAPLTPMARAFLMYFSGRFPQVMRVVQ